MSEGAAGVETVFIINPKAGTGKNIEKLIAAAESVAEVYITRSAGDGERFVREYCRTKGAARFIACGGDGTLNEVVNGAVGCSDAEIGVIPAGTGNDFCRNFGEADFSDINAQISGKTVRCDVIKYTTDNKSGCCINMFNIGFDCNVADMTAKMKKKPFISGSMAYLLSIFAILIKKKGANIKIELDGEEFFRGRLLLTSLANGKYCGGGIKSNPLASLSDGKININVIYNISRLNFLTKLPFYMKGTHIKLREIEKIIYNTWAKKIVITPLDGVMRICIDGEIITAGKTEFEIMPAAVNVVVPSTNVKIENMEEISV